MPERWIRFERKPARFHLLWSEQGFLTTLCGRMVYRAEVIAETENPPARCRCCRSRSEHPYLVPVELRALRQGVAE
ncbi:MAG: hypothetical protein LAQ30_01680 [Acidobacteriia bacterium]|nr:hypothetical protein [Terriglobia bacterium]